MYTILEASWVLYDLQKFFTAKLAVSLLCSSIELFINSFTMFQNLVGQNPFRNVGDIAP